MLKVDLGFWISPLAFFKFLGFYKVFWGKRVVLELIIKRKLYFFLFLPKSWRGVCWWQALAFCGPMTRFCGISDRQGDKSYWEGLRNLLDQQVKIKLDAVHSSTHGRLRQTREGGWIKCRTLKQWFSTLNVSENLLEVLNKHPKPWTVGGGGVGGEGTGGSAEEDLIFQKRCVGHVHNIQEMWGHRDSWRSRAPASSRVALRSSQRAPRGEDWHFGLRDEKAEVPRDLTAGKCQNKDLGPGLADSRYQVLIPSLLLELMEGYGSHHYWSGICSLRVT